MSGIDIAIITAMILVGLSALAVGIGSVILIINLYRRIK